MAKGGLRVPDPVVLRKHVLVMSFIGCFLVKKLVYRLMLNKLTMFDKILHIYDNIFKKCVSGAEGKPAPKLKEAAERMSEKQMEDAYNQVSLSITDVYILCTV